MTPSISVSVILAPGSEPGGPDTQSRGEAGSNPVHRKSVAGKEKALLEQIAE